MSLTPPHSATDDYCASSAYVHEVVKTVLAFDCLITQALKEGALACDKLFPELKKVAELMQKPHDAATAEIILQQLDELCHKLPVKTAALETSLEKDQMRVLIAEGKSTLTDFIFYDKYKNLVRKEWALLREIYSEKDLKNMRYAFVGCGMPLTALGFADVHDIDLDCYDIDPQVVDLARNTVGIFGMSDKLRVMQAHALEIDYTDYDVVFIANLVQPRVPVLQRLAAFKNIKGIITRRVSGIVSLIYSSLDENLLDELGLYRAVLAENDKTSVHQSMLLMRKMS